MLSSSSILSFVIYIGLTLCIFSGAMLSFSVTGYVNTFGVGLVVRRSADKLTNSAFWLTVLYTEKSQFMGIVLRHPCSGELWTQISRSLSGENTELKRFPFKAWSRSVSRHTCYAYCQGFLPCLFLPFRSIHLHFFQNFSRFFLCWLWLTHGSCVGPQNKIGHPAGCRFPC